MDPDARFADAENQTSETQKQQTSLDVLRQLDAGSKSTPDEKDGAAVRDGDWARMVVPVLAAIISKSAQKNDPREPKPFP